MEIGKEKGKPSWKELTAFFREQPEVKTRLGKKFYVKHITDYGLFCLVPEEIIFISREDIEKALELISQGKRISSPRDYLQYVSKNYPSYAYGIIKTFLFPVKDRRRWPRVQTRVPVQIIYKGKIITTSTIDISAGGIRIKLSIELSEKEHYPVIVTLDDGGEPINTIARVVWHSTQEDGVVMGMEFIHIEDFDRLRIAEFVKRKLQDLE